jgi:hypothetical protein
MYIDNKAPKLNSINENTAYVELIIEISPKYLAPREKLSSRLTKNIDNLENKNKIEDKSRFFFTVILYYN